MIKKDRTQHINCIFGKLKHVSLSRKKAYYDFENVVFNLNVPSNTHSVFGDIFGLKTSKKNVVPPISFQFDDTLALSRAIDCLAIYLSHVRSIRDLERLVFYGANMVGVY